MSINLESRQKGHGKQRNVIRRSSRSQQLLPQLGNCLTPVIENVDRRLGAWTPLLFRDQLQRSQASVVEILVLDGVKEPGVDIGYVKDVADEIVTRNEILTVEVDGGGDAGVGGGGDAEEWVCP